MKQSHTSIRIRPLFLLFLSLFLFGIAGCSQETRSTPEVIESTDQYLFFPYQACIVCTIKQAEIERSPKAWNNGYIKLTVDVENVLKGNFVEGTTKVLTFNEPLAEITSDKSLAELPGLKCVLAFHHVSELDGLLAIHNIFSPFPNQNFSQKDVQKLKQQLQMVSFPNRQCLMATIEEVKPANSTAVFEIKAHVDELLLSDEQDTLAKYLSDKTKDKGVLKLRLETDSDKERAQLMQLKPGMKSIFGFDHSFLEPKELLSSKWQVFRLYDVTTPFAGQRFNLTDVEKLRRRLALAKANSEKLKDALQMYMEERWTVDRIEKYCKPERRIAQPCCDLHTHNCSMTVSGQLHTALEKKIGKVTWYCGVDDGCPGTYQVSVDRPTSVPGLTRPDHWILECRPPTLVKLSNDEFLIMLISDTVYTAGLNYDFTHRDSKNTNLLKEIYTTTDKQLIYGKDGQAKAYTCILKSGKHLKAELDHTGRIETIQIDGQYNKLWKEAILTAAKNINKRNKFDEDYENAIRKEFALKQK